jgi:hypothetical protein
MESPNQNAAWRATPVRYTRPNVAMVFLAKVLLFLMVFSPVWGTALAGFAAWHVGAAVERAIVERPDRPTRPQWLARPQAQMP